MLTVVAKKLSHLVVFFLDKWIWVASQFQQRRVKLSLNLVFGHF